MNGQKTTLLASCGAGLEYYDFIIYGLLANYIGQQFFPSTNHSTSLIAAFGIFAMGYLVRPFGGVIFGIIGDRHGRKNAFTASIILMAASTFSMGLLPNFKVAGLCAPIMFMTFRIFQGISFGAELPGAITFISEHAGEKHRGSQCSIMASSLSVGACFGTFLIYIQSTLLTEHQMLLWGWRIPFLIGGILALVGYYIRYKTTETPYFIRKQHHVQHPFVELYKQYPTSILKCIGIMLFPASFIVAFLCLPSYLHNAFRYDVQDVYLATTFGYVWSAISLPVLGWISDRIKRKLLLFVTILIFAILSKPLFALLNHGNLSFLIIFILLYQTIISCLIVSFMAMLPEFFITNVRYTGIAFCYNIVYALAGFVPMLINYFLNTTKNPYSIVFLLLIVAIVTSFSLIFVNDLTGKELR